MRELALLQVQFANLPPGLADGFFVVSVGSLRKVGSGAGRHRRDAKLLAFLHQQRVKETRVVLNFS